MEEERRFKEFLIKELYLLREALEYKGFWNLSGEVNREITLRERIDKKSNKRCWLYDGCPCRTAGCCGTPDEGCPVYRYFKQLIE